MVVKHGVSTDSADRILVDAGAVYFNFYDADYPGTLLGATRGGNTFELARTIRRMEADGAKGPVKGFRRVEEVVATIKANMLELTAENLRRALAGAIYTAGYTQVTDEAVETGDDEEVDYILDHTPVQENTEEISVADRDPILQVRLTNYVINYTTGAVHFIVAPETGKAITATYKYLPETTPVEDENVGTQGNGEVTFEDTLENIPVEAGTIAVTDGVEIITDNGNGTLTGDAGGSGTIVYATGVLSVTFNSAPAGAITADYRYVSDASTIGGETTEANKYLIKDAAYLDNVVLVGTLTGKTTPIIVKITNALCDAGFSLALAPKDEAVIELTFTGHYANTDLDTEPWSVEYPAS